jgi:hypothetical protein
LKILVSVVRFRPRPPRFTLQKSQPSRVGFFVSGYKESKRLIGV